MASTAVKATLGFVGGAAFVGSVMGLLGGVAGYAAVKQAESEARRGWMVVPVVVAARDLKPGDTVTFDDVSQRSIPEQLVTASVVKPDSASYVVNQRLLAPVEAGEPLRWTFFMTPKDLQDVPLIVACGAAVSGAEKPPGSVEAIKGQIGRRKHK